VVFPIRSDLVPIILKFFLLGQSKIKGKMEDTSFYAHKSRKKGNYMPHDFILYRGITWNVSNCKKMGEEIEARDIAMDTDTDSDDSIDDYYEENEDEEQQQEDDAGLDEEDADNSDTSELEEEVNVSREKNLPIIITEINTKLCPHKSIDV
jgi:hypothetical protein